jgi:hypothetical protein
MLSGSRFFSHPGSRGQKGTGSGSAILGMIREDIDQERWLKVRSVAELGAFDGIYIVFLFWQEREKFCTSTQALLLLRCCGDLLTGKPHTVALLCLVELGSGFYPTVTRSEFDLKKVVFHHQSGALIYLRHLVFYKRKVAY